MASNATSMALPSTGAEKVKFTVFVRGHQWSSARHIHETLQEFAEVIQRNARRLNFIDEGDNIQRLQLARTDGSDPEELDVDATLEDVIICMGSKQLVAIINSPRGAPAACSACPEGGKPCTSPILECVVPKLLENDNVSAPISKLPQMQSENLEMPSLGPAKSSSYILKHRSGPFKSACDPGGRGLKITIPSTEHNAPVFHDDRGIPFGQDYSNGDRHAAVLPPPMSSRSANLNASLICGNGGGIPTGLMNSASTPSPAELAHFLVRGSSSIPANRVSNGNTLNGSHLHAHGNGAMAATHSGFQSFAPTMMNRLPPMPTSNNPLPCQAPATPNIALLAQFLASQLRAFIPVNGMGSHHNNPALTSCPANAVGSMKGYARATTDLGPNLRKGPTDHLTTCCKVEGAVKESPRSAPGNPKASVSESHDKDESSSSANVNNTAAPSSDGIESELQHTNGHRRSEMIFLVNRRSKTGVGTHHLRMSDLSAFFHLSVVDAAKKLGVSQTTLKKACRKFGLKRWPGRKVRSLESTIHGLEHTIAVGHGAGMEELTEAYMRSEVTKLQQEMDQLVHGTPISQHSPVARTADLYKRLYSRGWRSKYHSPCNRFDLDLNRDSRDTDQAYSKAGDETKPAMKGANGCHEPRKEQVPADLKDDSHSQTSRESQDITHKEQGNGNMKRSSNMDLDTTIKEESTKEDLEPAKLVNRDTYMAEDAKRHMPAEEAEATPAKHRRVDSANHIHAEQILDMETQSANNNHVAHADRPFAPERSPKRPKRDCSDLSDAALHELSVPL